MVRRRAARRLKPWQQIRTRGHPSRRPRFARAPQDEVGVVERFEALQDSGAAAASSARLSGCRVAPKITSSVNADPSSYQARPHGEEARHSRRSLRTLGCDARRLEPWQQVRTRGHPSRRPRHSASKTRVNALTARAPQDEVGGRKDSQPLRMTEIGGRASTRLHPLRFDDGDSNRPREEFE